MIWIEVTTQAELDKAIEADPKAFVLIKDGGYFRAYGSATVDAYDSATVHAYDSATVHASDSATVHASGSATVHASDSATVHASGSATVHAYDSATVHASGSATVHASGSATVHAYDSATVHASDSATVHASGSATVHASKYVAVHRRHQAKVTGGVVIEVPKLDTAEAWLDYYGVDVKDGVAVLFKAVDDDYVSSRSFKWTPGTTPEEIDGRWNPSPTINCGEGLHFCPRPHIALGYNRSATRFVACPVAVDEIVVYKYDDQPTKVRAPRCVAPVYEVDVNGEPIEAKA